MKRTLLFVFVSLLAASSAAGQSPHELFQQALRLESSQGDLEGAIALYERIGAAYGSDRALGARALFRMGQVYETLGRIEAERAYRRVVADFADQTDTAGQARARLVSLVAAAPVEPAKPLIQPELTFQIGGSPFSRDGKYFVNTNWDTRRMGYQEVGTDEVIYFSSAGEYAPVSGRFSPDNRYIAYATDDTLANQYIKVFDTRDRSIRTIRTADENWYFEVYDWTSDGSAVLVLLQQFFSGGETNLSLVDVTTGETRLSQRPEGEFAYEACLLEDRYVLYQYLSSAGKDLRVVDLENGDQTTFLGEASEKALGGCSDQRNLVVIQTDLFGEPQAWTYAVSRGRPVAEPEPLREIGTDDEVIGFTDEGDVFVVKRNPPSTALYPFSAERGTIAGRGEALPDLPNFSGQVQGVPSWTNDGARLVYPIGAFTVWVREQDGTAYSVMLPNNFLAGVDWSDDGTAFWQFRWSSETQSRTAVRIDAKSGQEVSGSHGIAYVFPRRKDAATLCLNRIDHPSFEIAELYCYEDARSAKVTFDPVFRNLPATRSGTSGRLAVISSDSAQTTLFTLVDFDAGTSKLLLEGAHWSDRAELLPDDSSMLALTRDGLFFRVPFDGAPPEPWFVSFTDVNEVRTFTVHPTENQILIVSAPRVEGAAESPAEIRVLRGVTDRTGSKEY